MNETGAETGIRYRAFISYSHHDLAAAKRLHRQLEAYRIPKNLIGRETARGQIPARLTPIFRDVDELPASDDLSAEIKAALADSGALIVLCSPAARGSRWVNREIETFRQLHGHTRPILAALIEGEPEAAFPAALTADGTEPIAADFRKSADGSRLARMKLVAGLTGASLDTLVQRDAQARLRRVTAITVAALISMLAMALLLVAALRARSEADRQRAKAEGLVEYMLTDLREKLKGVGRLDVMTAVNERAMAYYGDQQSLEGLPPESLDRRARILHAMGEDDEKRGDLDKALVKFKEAHRTTAAVLAKKPNDPDAIFAHAQSEYWVGRIAEIRRDWDSAEVRYRAYASGASRLVGLRPNDPNYKMEMAWGHMNLGNVRLESRTPPDYGQVEYQLALKWMESALNQKPDDKAILTEMGNAYAWLADTYFIRGNFKQSLAERKNQLRMARKNLLAHEDDAVVRFEAAKATFSVAINLRKTGSESEAQNLLRSANLDADRLVSIDKNNKEWKRLSIRIHESIVKKGEVN